MISFKNDKEKEMFQHFLDDVMCNYNSKELKIIITTILSNVDQIDLEDIGEVDAYFKGITHAIKVIESMEKDL